MSERAVEVEMSVIGERAAGSDITELMTLLGDAMQGREVVAMMGGGNPAAIEAVRDEFSGRLLGMAADPGLAASSFYDYGPPQGIPAFREAFAGFLNDMYDFRIGPKNVAVVPGSQAGMQQLINAYGGSYSDGSFRRIVLPAGPEYVGYKDQPNECGVFWAPSPRIERIGDHEFKYGMSERVVINGLSGAVLMSRPTNPTGNVVADDEIGSLRAQAEKYNVPMIIDNAYGLPFPGVMSEGAMPEWGDDLVLTFSLSKIGLPGVRLGMVVASEDRIALLSSMTAIDSLTSAGIGQQLALPYFRDGSILDICQDHIQPYYAERAERARIAFASELDDNLPYRFHVHEGSYFFWLWLEDMPISSRELFRRLVMRDVIVSPGEYFALDDTRSSEHEGQCVRINFARPDREIERGAAIIAEEVKRAYAGAEYVSGAQSFANSRY